MKTIFVILLILVSNTSIGQVGSEYVVFPESHVLFEGFNEHLIIDIPQRKLKKYSVECDDCDTIFKLENGKNHYIIRADNQGDVRIIVKTAKGKIVVDKKVWVTAIPPPILTINGHSTENILTRTPDTLELIKRFNLPVNFHYVISMWKLTDDSKTFTGYGNSITTEVKNYLLNKSSGVFKIEIDYMSYDGKHKLVEHFDYKIE